MICDWIKIEKSKNDPVTHHSSGSKIQDVSDHVLETALLDPIKIVEVIQPKIAAFVQTVCVEKQGANAKNGNELQEIRTPASTAPLCNRTRCFQYFSRISDFGTIVPFLTPRSPKSLNIKLSSSSCVMCATI